MLVPAESRTDAAADEAEFFEMDTYWNAAPPNLFEAMGLRPDGADEDDDAMGRAMPSAVESSPPPPARVPDHILEMMRRQRAGQ